VRAFRESLDFSPRELDELEDRLALLRRLSKKYGATEEDMLEYLESCKSELAAMESSDERMAELGSEIEKLAAKAQSLASRLSEARKAAGEKLSRKIVSELSALNMSGVLFETSISPVGGEYGLCADGCDSVSFLMSANAGEKPGRISRIASGGELSRIMLAMKNVLSENDAASSMVFDEIDAGVSGIAAQRVGEKLAALSAKKQVLCVTHLPQIAAMADVHFSVSKAIEGGRTYTEVRSLDDEGRARELARLHGGDNVTETTMSSAREQLEAARRFKMIDEA